MSFIRAVIGQTFRQVCRSRSGQGTIFAGNGYILNVGTSTNELRARGHCQHHGRVHRDGTGDIFRLASRILLVAGSLDGIFESTGLGGSTADSIVFEGHALRQVARHRQRCIINGKDDVGQSLAHTLVLVFVSRVGSQSKHHIGVHRHSGGGAGGTAVTVGTGHHYLIATGRCAAEAGAGVVHGQVGGGFPGVVLSSVSGQGGGATLANAGTVHRHDGQCVCRNGYHVRYHIAALVIGHLHRIVTYRRGGISG